MNQDNLFPGNTYTSPINLKGDDIKTCKTDILNQAQTKKQPIDIGSIMGELQHVINKTNILNCPISLDPKNSTFLDVGLWAYYHRRLSISTVDKRLRYARYMQNHIVPVDFHNPSYLNFRQHIDYREAVEGASPHALHHEWKTMRMFLQAYNIPIWPYKPPITPVSKKMIIPYPYTVREFFYYPYSKNQYETKLYQFIFQHGFMIGFRAPSEICEMTLDDIDIDCKGNGTITITETKKRKQKRTIAPEKHILSSQSHKSIKNYIDNWRSQVENEHSGNALYLWPSGKPVTVRLLGHKLSEHGKKIWSKFKPYDMRYWCAVSRLIETRITGDGETYDIYKVMDWLGHESPTETKKYTRFADMYYRQYKKSWIRDALRLPKRLRGKHHGLTNRVKDIITTLFTFPPVSLLKPQRAHLRFKEGIVTEFTQNTKLCFLGISKYLTKIFSGPRNPNTYFSMPPFLSFYSGPVPPFLGGGN